LSKGKRAPAVLLPHEEKWTLPTYCVLNDQGKASREYAQSTFQKIAQSTNSRQTRLGLTNAQKTKAGKKAAYKKQ